MRHPGSCCKPCCRCRAGSGQRIGARWACRPALAPSLTSRTDIRGCDSSKLSPQPDMLKSLAGRNIAVFRSVLFGLATRDSVESLPRYPASPAA